MSIRCLPYLLSQFPSGGQVTVKRSVDDYLLSQALGGTLYWRVWLRKLASADIRALRDSYIYDGDVLQCNIFSSVFSTWEYAIAPLPEGASTYQFQGNGHGLDVEQSLTIQVDGVPVVLDDGESCTGESAQVRRISYMGHDELESDIAKITTIYAMEPSGLRLNCSIEWLTNGEVKTGYVLMLPLDNSFTRASLLDVGTDYTLDASDNQQYGRVEADAAYAWDVSADAIVMWESEDLSYPTSNKLFFLDTAEKNKLYPALWDEAHPQAFAAGDVWQFEGTIRADCCSDPEAVLASLVEHHVYVGLKRVDLADNEWSAVQAAVKAHGASISLVGSPSYVNHWVCHDSFLVLEALWLMVEISVSAAGQILSDALGAGVDWDTSEDSYGGFTTLIVTYSVDGTDKMKYYLFGTVEGTWQESGDECREYLKLYMEEWEPKQ